jgi:hypothetical protein
MTKVENPFEKLFLRTVIEHPLLQEKIVILGEADWVNGDRLGSKKSYRDRQEEDGGGG